MNTKGRLGKGAILFAVGGIIYVLIELAFRGRSHWTMALLGGLSFILIGAINEYLPWRMGLIWQMLIGGGIITAMELAFGLILNLYLGLSIWDYSKLPFNLWGQICLSYSMAWAGLSLVGILLDDFIRWRFFGEEKPRYTIFG